MCLVLLCYCPLLSCVSKNNARAAAEPSRCPAAICRLIRQQDSVIDGGGIAHAHYKLQLWPGGGGTASSSGSGSQGGDAASSSSRGAGAGSAVRGTASGARTLLGGAAAGETLVTDELWVSPPANFVKGDWDEDYMEEVGRLLFYAVLLAPTLQSARRNVRRRCTAAEAVVTHAAASGSDALAPTTSPLPANAPLPLLQGLLHMLSRTFVPPSGISGSSSSSSGNSSGSSGSGNSSGSSGPQLTVDFVVGAHARWQMRHVRRYLAELADAPGADGSRVLAVLSLCVWEQKHIWPK